MSAKPEIWSTVSRWQSAQQQLGIVYLRSGGGMIQTGLASITSLNEASLTLRSTTTSVIVVLVGAHFDDSPQIFFTADLSGNFQLSGVSIALANHDWLFLTDSPQAGQLSLKNVTALSLDLNSDPPQISALD